MNPDDVTLPEPETQLRVELRQHEPHACDSDDVEMCGFCGQTWPCDRVGHCAVCERVWPCDANRALVALVSLEATVATLVEAASRYDDPCADLDCSAVPKRWGMRAKHWHDPALHAALANLIPAAAAQHDARIKAEAVAEERERLLNPERLLAALRGTHLHVERTGCPYGLGATSVEVEAIAALLTENQPEVTK